MRGFIIVLTLMLGACDQARDHQDVSSETDRAARHPLFVDAGGVSPTGRYGAYAFAPQARYGAFVLDGPSAPAADKEALRTCQDSPGNKGGDCKLLARFSGGCAAVAAARNGVYLAAAGAEASAACSAALVRCRQEKGEQCAAVTVGCLADRSVQFCKDVTPAASPSPSPSTSFSAAPRPDTESAPRGSFGAIAVSDSGVHAGFGSGKVSRSMAEATALASCRNDLKRSDGQCAVKLWYQNACGALATGDDGAFGTGWGNSWRSACGWALKTCRDYGGRNCEANWYECSPGKRSGSCDGTFTQQK